MSLDKAEWIPVTERLPDSYSRVLAWFDGWEEHSGATWHRHGMRFAVYWYPGVEHSTDGWSNELLEKARKELGATHLTITHWMPLPKRPEGA